MSESLPIVYGAGYSVYVRSVLMTIAAKGVRHLHESVDIFATGGAPARFLAIHPFGKIPAFRHGGFALYETIAITRYIDEAFDGPPLQPAEPASRARMTQLMCMADSYGYRPLVWDIYVERSSKPRAGKPSDEGRIAAAMPRARTFLSAVNDLAHGPVWLLGDGMTLADFHLAPMFGYFRQTPEGQKLIAEFPRLGQWCDAVFASAPWRLATAPILPVE